MIIGQRASGLKINGKLGDYIVSEGAIQKGDFVQWSAGSFTGVGDIGTPVVAPDNYQTIVMDDHNILCYGLDSSAGIYGYTVNISDAGVITYGTKTLLYSQSGIETVSGCLLEANKAFIVGTTKKAISNTPIVETYSQGTAYYCVVTFSDGALNVAGTSTSAVNAHDFKVCTLNSTTVFLLAQRDRKQYTSTYVSSLSAYVYSLRVYTIDVCASLITVSGTMVSAGTITTIERFNGRISSSNSTNAVGGLQLSATTIGTNNVAIVVNSLPETYLKNYLFENTCKCFSYAYALSISGTTITAGTEYVIYDLSRKAAAKGVSVIPDGGGGFSVAISSVDILYEYDDDDYEYDYYYSSVGSTSVFGFSASGTTISAKYTGVLVGSTAIYPQQLIFDDTTLVFVLLNSFIYLYPITVESSIASVGNAIALVTAGSEAFFVEYLEGLGAYIGYYTSSSDYGVLLDLSFNNLVYPYTEATTKHGIAFQSGNIGESIKVYTPIL